MALNETALWLVAYDIADPRRLQRVHRLLKQEATPIQYSLFCASDTQQGILGLKARLAREIDERNDDVRIYRLPRRPEIATIGAPLLPEGLMLLDDVGVAGSLVPHAPWKPQGAEGAPRSRMNRRGARR